MPLEPLSFAERRVLGVLIEKGFTTPEQYPLSLNSVVTGSNQKSCREPLSNLEEEAVLDSLQSLRRKGFTKLRSVPAMIGRMMALGMWMQHLPSLHLLRRCPRQPFRLVPAWRWSSPCLPPGIRPLFLMARSRS